MSLVCFVKVNVAEVVVALEESELAVENCSLEGMDSSLEVVCSLEGIDRSLEVVAGELSSLEALGWGNEEDSLWAGLLAAGAEF